MINAWSENWEEKEMIRRAFNHYLLNFRDLHGWGLELHSHKQFFNEIYHPLEDILKRNYEINLIIREIENKNVVKEELTEEQVKLFEEFNKIKTKKQYSELMDKINKSFNKSEGGSTMSNIPRWEDLGEKYLEYDYEAHQAYVFGLYHSSIFSSVAAVEQILKHLCLTADESKFQEKLKEVEYMGYKGHGITFGQLIQKCEVIEKLKPHISNCYKLNDIRNKVSVHSKYISVNSKKKYGIDYDEHIRKSLNELMSLLDEPEIKQIKENYIMVEIPTDKKKLHRVIEKSGLDKQIRAKITAQYTIEEVLSTKTTVNSTHLQYCWYDLRWEIYRKLALKAFYLMTEIIYSFQKF